jgi:hypothetical protein
MALITTISDPALYAKLVTEVTKYETSSGWVVYQGIHYKVKQDSNGDMAFEAYDSIKTAKSTSI